MSSPTGWRDAVLRELDPAIERTVDVPAASVCTWRVGGPLALVVRPRDEHELVALASALDPDVDRLVLGRGSNLLVSDDGFDGVVVALGSEFEHSSFHPEPRADGSDTGPVVVTAGGALALPVFARRCGAAGVAGLEFFVGIPGSVGGAVRMNAGGHGRETCDVVIDFTVVDLDRATTRVVDAASAGFRYRHSDVGASDVVVSARFRGEYDDRVATAARLDAIVAWRRANQPGGANAGSVFTNPVGESAGQLIDSAGLKGLRVGGASVSTKHANFIQADAGASARDVAALIELVAERVHAAHGVTLHTEVHMVGLEHPPTANEEMRT